MLVVLLILPGGLGGLWVKLRDVAVRLLTRPRGPRHLGGISRRRWNRSRPETDPAQMRGRDRRVDRRAEPAAESEPEGVPT